MNPSIVIALFVSIFASSCTAGPESPGADKPEGNTLLWKVERKGVKTSWIFGTMHMICKDDYVWTPAMERALKQSESVCLEMDMDDPSVMMEVAAGLMETGGKELKDYFTPEEYSRLERYVTDSLNGNLAIFAKMKPFALQSLFINKLGNCGAFVSYENKIMEEAQKQKKEILGLETAARQLALVNSIPADTLVSSIMEMVDHPQGDRKEYEAMIAAYRSQDLPELHRILMETSSMADLSGPLLEQRNEEWIGKMENMMNAQSVFFAVGAGHLSGEKGVISLLREQGYTVTGVYE